MTSHTTATTDSGTIAPGSKGVPLKQFFEARLAAAIAVEVQTVHPGFPGDAFVVQATQGLEALELTERSRQFMAALHACLPADYPTAIGILLATLGPETQGDELTGMAPFRYLPYVQYVAAYGLAHFELSLRAQYELTKRFTAEFSIRPFLERYQERTLAVLAEWATDPNPHVRRLVSEGTRPRLPWAPRLRSFQLDPTPVLALLERLKDDPSLYVRRSVANNLNDIGKDHPDVLIAVCQAWSEGASPERWWLIRHALRSAVKRGDRAAMAVLGASDTTAVSVLESQIEPAALRSGGEVACRFRIRSDAQQAQVLVVDLAVHFVKANGQSRPKVFKLRQLTLAPGQVVALGKALSLAPMSTRRHYPGRHQVELLVNGQAIPAGAFELLP